MKELHQELDDLLMYESMSSILQVEQDRLLLKHGPIPIFTSPKETTLLNKSGILPKITDDLEARMGKKPGEFFIPGTQVAGVQLVKERFVKPNGSESIRYLDPNLHIVIQAMAENVITEVHFELPISVLPITNHGGTNIHSFYSIGYPDDPRDQKAKIIVNAHQHTINQRKHRRNSLLSSYDTHMTIEQLCRNTPRPTLVIPAKKT